MARRDRPTVEIELSGEWLLRHKHFHFPFTPTYGSAALGPPKRQGSR